MNGQEKKRRRICDLLNADTKAKKFPEIIGVSLSYLPTPPLGQDMTQGPFF